MESIVLLIIAIYVICHIPAIILLIFGLNKLKSSPEKAKTALIVAGIYFLIGWGICGSMLI